MKDLTKSDYVLVMAGSNDFGNNEPGHLTIHQAMDKILSSSFNTNIIVSAIPSRYDRPQFNDDIHFANICISGRISSYCGASKVIYTEVNRDMQRHHFTKKGLHYSKNGKRFMGKILCDLVTSDSGIIANCMTRRTTAEKYVPSKRMENNDNVDAITIDDYSLTSSPAPLIGQSHTTWHGGAASNVRHLTNADETLHQLDENGIALDAINSDDNLHDTSQFNNRQYHTSPFSNNSFSLVNVENNNVQHPTCFSPILQNSCPQSPILSRHREESSFLEVISMLNRTL